MSTGGNVYRLANYALSRAALDEATAARRKILTDWERLKKHGVSDGEISTVTGISRATYYRRKAALKRYGIKGLQRRSSRPKSLRKSTVPDDVRTLVLTLRRAHPTYGKAKIHAILVRDHAITISESTIGRILKALMEQGLIQKYAAARKTRRKRKFDKHAKRWTYDLRPKQPGDMVQIDHMPDRHVNITVNQIGVKHFQAWDPITKSVHAQLYAKATAKSSVKFLDELQGALGFPIRSIQVDGGSEFMSLFEDACKEKEIPLYVLPPKSPQKNGGVERMNRTMREDLYNRPNMSADSIGALRFELKNALKTYNMYRPHQALDNQTPHQYTQNILKEIESHSI